MELKTPERHLEATGVVASKTFSVRMDAHMMHLLSGLYADIPWAIVREYWSNGEDGHDALTRQGLKPARPLEIHVPNTLEPWFEVRDYGIGMDHDTVFEIYTQYGNSTKSNNNLDIGGFGIGAKAAFCYDIADQWTIESRYNGTGRVYVASKDEASMPTLVLLSETPTQEPTGISVRVPVLGKDINAFRAAISRFAKRRKHPFVIKGDVNGLQAGQYSPISYVNQTPEFGWRNAGSGEHGVQAVMGGVPYPVDLTKQELNISSKERQFLGKQGSVDFFFDIGELDITPSREALMYTPRTIKILKDRMPRLFSNTVQAFQAGLAKCKNHWEAVEYIAKNEESYEITRSSLGGGQPVMFKGKAIGPNSHLEVELDAIIAAHAKAPTGVKAAVFSKYYGQFERLKDALPLSYLQAANPGTNPALNQGLLVSNGGRTSIHITSDALRLQAPIVVIADCPGALNLMREYWKQSTQSYSTRTEMYLVYGKGMDAKVLSDSLEGYPVHSANTLTQALQAAKSLNATTASKKPASLHLWRNGYMHLTEIDLTVGGYYIPMYDRDFDVAEVQKFLPGRSMGMTQLHDIIKSLTTLGHITKDTLIVGVPKTRMKRVQGLAHWKNFWTHFKPIINKEIAKGIPQNPTRGDQVLKELDSLEYVVLLRALKGAVPKGPLKSLQAAADKRRQAITALTQDLDKFNAISILRTVMTGNAQGKTRKTNPKGIDIGDLRDYNMWLGKRYPMVEILRSNSWGLDRILAHPGNISSIVNYIHMVDATNPVQNAPKLS